MPLVRSVNIRKTPCAFLVLLLAFFLADHCAMAHAQTPIYPVTAPPLPLSFGSFFALGDFKGNGEADLAYTSATSPTSGTLNIDLDITGGSPTVVSTPFNCTPASGRAGVPVLGDVNSDGKLDVVFSCTNYVVVLLGNGDGSFQSPAYYAVNTLSAPTLMDLNGDHFLDIAVFSSGTSASQATVFLNNGSSSPGVFGAAANYSASIAQAPPAGFEVLASGDFNGDGKQDVIASASNGFFLFFGKGDGTLQPASVQSVIPKDFPLSFTVGDFNQDGITDVAVLSSSIASYSPTTNPSYSGIQILLGSSSGNLTQGATLPAVGNGPNSVEIINAALTSGGNLDLIVGGEYTTVFQGDGKGNFTQPTSYAANGTPFVFDVNGNGKPDLLLFDSGLSILTGNGDGTFQGLRTTPLNATGNSSLVSADFNNDGVADVAFIPPQGSCGPAAISVDLGRGDGTFAPLDQTVATSGTTCDGVDLVPADFNQDGKTDLVAIAQGHGYEVGGVGPTDAQLFFYAGNGNGTFQPAGPALDLGATHADAIIGDFNGDGKLDLIVNFSQDPTAPTTGSGVLFLPGNGDGTFGTPVQFAQINPGTLFAADLTHNGKLDLVGGASGGTVFLGNGAGTFKQLPLNLILSGNIAALADMNGDGYPDLVVCGSIYAGNGDGTFQTSPFYTVSIPNNNLCQSAAVGDVNGDGNLDLVVYSNPTQEGPSQLSVSFGDGHGNFTADPNTYFAGAAWFGSGANLLLTRLNNNAPALSSDHALDALVTSYSDLTGLLNQKNPAPSAPAVFNSSLTLQSSVASANENASITLTASVLGTNPAGSVTFSANGTSLGTATLTNGTATLQTSFASVGTYTVTASYPGDANNSASTSNTVSITVASPDFTVASSPMSATISPGQTATFSLTVTPVGGYTGTVNFSCGSLPSEATCTFSPSSVTPNGSAATSTLTISTTAAVAALRTPPTGNQVPWIPAGSLALAGIVGFFIAPKKRIGWNRQLLILVSAILLSGAWALIGCGGSATTGNNNHPQNPGTPSGTYTVSVSLSGSAGGPSHTLSLQVAVQ